MGEERGRGGRSVGPGRKVGGREDEVREEVVRKYMYM